MSNNIGMIYIVRQKPDDRIRGVFSTREKAETYVEPREEWKEKLYIDGYPLDTEK